MQKAYLQIGNKDVFNNQYMLAVFKIIPYGDETLESAATEVAAESSNGSNLPVGSGTPFSNTMGAIVYDIDVANHLAYIAYPWAIFDRIGNVQNILTFIAGNVLGMGNLAGCKLLDVWFPPEMLGQYDGPNVNIDNMREYLGRFDRPILGTIIKPKIGLSSTEYAELCYDFWVGGGDFVKNDEPQADQYFSPYFEMVDSVRRAMDRAEDATGQKKIHSFNVSAADFDTMLKRADYVQSKMKPGSYAFLVDGITAGWTAVQTIRRHYPDVFLHFHRAGHGAFTRKENPFGFSVPVLSKMARLAGASGIHTGTAGVGKMDGSPEEDVNAIHQCLRVESEGEFFTQVWSKVPASDRDVQIMIENERKIYASGPREVSNMRKSAQKIDLQAVAHAADWRVMSKCTPIISGGLNPPLLGKFIDTAGTIDFIVTMGGGVHSHPMETTAGTKALVEAFDAWQSGKSLNDAANDGMGYDTELASSVRFYDKHGTQSHHVDQTKTN
ncbi:MAG: ribulose-bisphosphate carboxylase [Candidatus Dojkabacteria bacterium]